jgi:nitroreductase
MKASPNKMEIDIADQSEDTMGQESFDPVKTPYEVDEHNFPRTGSLKEQFMFLVRYAVLAPSSYNTQPWKFEIHDDGIAVYADYSRRLPVADPGNRELLMGVSAAVMNLRVVAEHFRFGCRVDYYTSDDSEKPLAFVYLAQGVNISSSYGNLGSLFSAITTRHTNRNPFLITRIPDSVLLQLRTLDEESQANLFFSTDGKVNQSVADLVALADRKLQADPTYRRELAEWTRPNWTQKPDGMIGASFGVGGVKSALRPWATKVLDLGRWRAAADMNLCGQAPGLIVLYGEDSVPVWLRSGELLQRLLLSITRQGLQYGFFNMPIEVPELRVQLRGLLGLSAWPQLLLRLGYCLTEPAPSPRRPIEEVIIEKKPNFC